MSSSREKLRARKRASKIGKALTDNDRKAADNAIGEFSSIESSVPKNKARKLSREETKQLKRQIGNISSQQTDEQKSVKIQMARGRFARGTQKFRGIVTGPNCGEGMTYNKRKKTCVCKKGRKCGPPGKIRYTTEPIPDYIMRAIQPKKSVHSVYGKLRY